VPPIHPIDGEAKSPDPAPPAGKAYTRETSAGLSGLEARVAEVDLAKSRQDYSRQGEFLFIRDFLPQRITERLIAAAVAVTPMVHRNYLPRHKQGGSVSRHVIDLHAPFIAELYRSQALIAWLSKLAGERLLPSPPDDPHAYALYFYTRAGDHIGWHYDTSYYAGRRYTLLFGLIDQSTCRLDYQLHTREAGVAPLSGTVQIPPGGLVFFDGDKLRHRISRLGTGERRVSLTFEYVTDPRMRFSRRLISNMKDAVAYFGFGQVFRQARRQGSRGAETGAKPSES
jgi:hypothetical protein